MTSSDLLQLHPVRGKLLFSQISDEDSMKNLLGLQFYYSFKYAELTEAVRQNYKLSIAWLNKFEFITLMM